MHAIRNSAKAIIVRDDCILAIEASDHEGTYYLLPGGGQLFGETLHETLQRECLEEISCRVVIGDIIFVREYIGGNHEYAQFDSHVHQVETMFFCSIPEGEMPKIGHTPDINQTGVAWLPLAELHEYRLYPRSMGDLFRTLSTADGTASRPVYHGDRN